MTQHAKQESLIAEYSGDYPHCYEHGLLAVIDGNLIVPFNAIAEKFTTDEQASLECYMLHRNGNEHGYFAWHVERWLVDRASRERTRVTES